MGEIPEKWTFQQDVLTRVTWLNVEFGSSGKTVLRTIPTEDDWIDLIPTYLNPKFPLWKQSVILPNKLLINAAAFFEYMDEPVFMAGPGNPSWRDSCIQARMELDAGAAIKIISGVSTTAIPE